MLCIAAATGVRHFRMSPWYSKSVAGYSRHNQFCVLCFLCVYRRRWKLQFCGGAETGCFSLSLTLTLTLSHILTIFFISSFPSLGSIELFKCFGRAVVFFPRASSYLCNPLQYYLWLTKMVWEKSFAFLLFLRPFPFALCLALNKSWCSSLIKWRPVSHAQ